MSREDEIRLIAYQIWEDERCINGHDCEHWVRAEQIWERQQQEQKKTVTKKAKKKTAHKIKK